MLIYQKEQNEIKVTKSFCLIKQEKILKNYVETLVDMSNDENKQLYRVSWEEEPNFFCVDRSKKRDQGRNCNCNESKNIYIESNPETKPSYLT